MFIRRTRTRSIGEYFTFRLVRSERIGDQVRQRTLLNLGRHFDVAQSDWPMLCRRIDELLAGQLPLPPDGPPAPESHAQRITALLLAGERIGAASSPATPRHDFQHVDVDSLELISPPLGRRGARRPVGDGPARPAHAARSTGHRGVDTLRRHRLHHRAHGSARLRARHRRALHPPPAPRLHADPPRRVLPAHQSNRLGRIHPVAHLLHPHRHRGRVPLPEIRARLTPHLSPQAHPRRRSSVHLRHRLSTRPGDSRRRRQTGQCASWTTLRRTLEGQQRITATFRQADGRTCTCAKPPAPNHPSRPSTRPWASTTHREGSAKPSSKRPSGTRL